VNVLATQSEIESLASRIERAYVLRRPQWRLGCSAARLWSTAASILYQVHRDDPAIPLDPELYVASQAGHPTFPDPWSELTQPAAAKRYRDNVRLIIRVLRRELLGEVRRAERKIRVGRPIEAVLLSNDKSLSPLGRFIVARRANRDDLMEQLRPLAIEQHHSCPLYRPASLRLLAKEAYPVQTTATSLELDVPGRFVRVLPHLN
jgi:hypothetical protein